LRDEAATNLQSRVDTLSEKLDVSIKEAMRLADNHALLLRTGVITPCKVLSGALNKIRPDNREDLAMVFTRYLGDQPLCDVKQSQTHNDLNQKLSIARHELEHSRAIAIARVKNPGCLLPSMLLVGVIAFFVAVWFTLDIDTARGALSDVERIRYRNLAVCAAAAVFLARLAQVCQQWWLTQRLKSAETACHASIRSCEEQMAIKDAKWRARLEKAGLLPHLDSLKQSLPEADKSASRYNGLVQQLTETTGEIWETLQFASAIGAAVKEPVSSGKCEALSPLRWSQPQEVIAACNRGNLDLFHIHHNQAVKMSGRLPP